MTTDNQDAEKSAKALLKFALGNHNAKRYKEAAGFYEVILKQYPDTEAAQYAKTNLNSLVNKIDGLEAVWPDNILISRIEQQSTLLKTTQNSDSPPIVEPSNPLPTTPKPHQEATASISKLRHCIYLKWKQLRITDSPYLLAGLFFLTALISYFAGREHVKYEIRQAFTGAVDGFLSNFGQNSVSKPIESNRNSNISIGGDRASAQAKWKQTHNVSDTQWETMIATYTMRKRPQSVTQTDWWEEAKDKTPAELNKLYPPLQPREWYRAEWTGGLSGASRDLDYLFIDRRQNLKVNLMIRTEPDLPIKELHGHLAFIKDGEVVYETELAEKPDVSFTNSHFVILRVQYDDSNAKHRMLRFAKDSELTPVFTVRRVVLADGKEKTFD